MDTENIVVDFKEKSPLSKKLLPLILLVSVIIQSAATYSYWTGTFCLFQK